MILDFGKESSDSIDLKPLRELLGASSSDRLVLTSSGQEAENLVLLGTYLEEARENGRNQIIVSKENETTQTLEELGCTVKVIKDDLESLITPRTALISMPLAESMTGAIHPVEEAAALCKTHGLALHVDVTSALGLMRIPDCIDFVTFDGLCPGMGGLLMKRLLPIFMAVKTPESSQVVLGLKAAQEALDNLDYTSLEIARLRNYFEKRIKEEIPTAEIVQKEAFRLPAFSAIRFPSVHSNALLYRLQFEGLYAKGKESCISFTLPREVTSDDLERAVHLLKEAVSFLSQVSQGAL